MEQFVEDGMFYVEQWCSNTIVSWKIGILKNLAGGGISIAYRYKIFLWAWCVYQGLYFVVSYLADRVYILAENGLYDGKIGLLVRSYPHSGFPYMDNPSMEKPDAEKYRVGKFPTR